MCYYLCVLRWLMRPILALNCLLQTEQERSEEESSVGDALALAFRCARFCSASLILFASYSPAPLFMRPRHFVRSCAQNNILYNQVTSLFCIFVSQCCWIYIFYTYIRIIGHESTRNRIFLLFCFFLFYIAKISF